MVLEKDLRITVVLLNVKDEVTNRLKEEKSILNNIKQRKANKNKRRLIKLITLCIGSPLCNTSLKERRK